LKYIPKTGSALLNLEIDSEIIGKMAENAYGSPHLMQEFCRELCRESNIVETSVNKISINNITLLKEYLKKLPKILVK